MTADKLGRMPIWLIIAWSVWAVLYSAFIVYGIMAARHWTQGRPDSTVAYVQLALLTGYSAMVSGATAVVYG